MHGQDEYETKRVKLADEARSHVKRALEALEGDVGAQQQLIGRWLDDDRPSAQAFWDYVALCGGLKVGTWNFVPAPTDIESVLNDDRNFSVTEYDRRMSATSGRFFLGMDDPEHVQDRDTGAIIPSWNVRDSKVEPDYEELERVRKEAATACRVLLLELAQRTRLARLLDPAQECRLTIAELLGRVLDASAAAFFGVPGPSSLSLISWAKDITHYHFRVHANDEDDRGRALQASGQFRAHVMALIAELKHPPREQPPQSKEPLSETQQRYKDLATAQHEQHRARLQANVDSIRRVLSKGSKRVASDDDVARNLIGIMTGSLTATAKAVDEALKVLATGSDQRIVWSHGVVACPYHGSAPARFPLYVGNVAKALKRVQRGSLDSVYRTYCGEHDRVFGTITVQRGEIVVVRLGNTLPSHPDNLFGIGIHKCPGMDMAKAIIDGMLDPLTQLRGDDSPRLRREDGVMYLDFDLDALAHNLSKSK